MRSDGQLFLRLKSQYRKRHHIITATLFLAVLLIPMRSSVNLTGQLGFFHKKIAVDVLDGGIVEEMWVADGQYVEQGDVLAKLIEPRLNAEMVSLLNATAVKLCRLARYEQLIRGGEFRIPEGYELIADDTARSYCRDEAETAKGLMRNFKDKLSMVDRQLTQARSDLSILEGSLKDEKRRLEIQGSLYQKRQELVEQNFYSEAALLEQESLLINSKQSLAAKSMELSDRRNRVLDLVRQKSDLESDFYDRNRTEQAAIRSEFESQYASLRASVRSNKSLTLYAPQSGYINKLNKARPGLLLSARETLLEIVPSTEDLVVVASYRPTDHMNIFVDQQASVRLLTHNQSLAPEFKGRVVSVSPDTKQASPLDPPTFEAIIRFDCNADCRQQHLLTAGVPVDVYILGGSAPCFLTWLTPCTSRVAKRFPSRIEFQTNPGESICKVSIVL